MKKIVLFIFAAVSLAGCHGGNDNPSGGFGAGVNGWIYGAMQNYYLWSESLPPYATSGAGRFSAPQYFESLRYRSDYTVSYVDDIYGDRFSSIGELQGATRAGETNPTAWGPGFMPVYVTDPKTGEIIYLQVCYVTPGSPAWGKIERGDRFTRINGTKVTLDNLENLIMSPVLAIDIFDASESRERSISIQNGSYYDNPIIADSIYQGGQTAYLAYTQFVTDGTTGNTGPAGDLRKAFARYKAAGVRNLILDLRYNGGGELTAAQLLASLISRYGDLGKPLSYLRGNSEANYESVDFLAPALVAENADIDKLVILTSGNSASASEMIIHCLKPYFGDDMIVVGETTVGKNLGGSVIQNKQLGWEMYLMMFYVYNIENRSGYERGIAPDIRAREFGEYPEPDTNPWLDMGTLGDYTTEHLLNVAMNRLFPEIPLMDFVEYGASSRGAANLGTAVPVKPRNLTL
jgi:C-terminal processing protease CtpA/Prc